MPVSIARVPTLHASRYLQQLAKHWSHKMDVQYDTEEARIAFLAGAVLEVRADSDTLNLMLTVQEGDDAERMRSVAAKHLDRFAFREGPLTFDWRERD